MSFCRLVGRALSLIFLIYSNIVLHRKKTFTQLNSNKMNSQVSDDLAKLVAYKDSLHKKREQVLNSIRANQNSFDDDVILCRVVVELTEEIKRLDLIFAQRIALNDCGLLDDVIQSEK